ncbi:MAG: hypothetical protein CBC71_06260 [Rhodobacteraceae bacterium TMED111]|nr:hypothetical protein [Marinovum sp.]OUV41102.1 MAG: hypothetical protein CBC71_06260 [Rhodobacteraceae bacterium TMED111]|tara:strand:- start:148 stop:345 length:198 start_codon:yes stop_codon:yes gene_type:complete
MNIIDQRGNKYLIKELSKYVWYAKEDTPPERECENFGMRAQGFVYLCTFDSKESALKYAEKEGFR